MMHCKYLLFLLFWVAPTPHQQTCHSSNPNVLTSARAGRPASNTHSRHIAGTPLHRSADYIHSILSCSRVGAPKSRVDFVLKLHRSSPLQSDPMQRIFGYPIDPSATTVPQIMLKIVPVLYERGIFRLVEIG